MTNFVVDASVVLSWIAPKKDSGPLLRLQDAVATGDVAIFAPTFLFAECLNVLRWRYGYEQKDAEDFLLWLPKLPINFVEWSAGELAKIINIVYSYHLTGYDALYLWLAQKMKCKLLSFDRGLLGVSERVVSPDMLF